MNKRIVAMVLLLQDMLPADVPIISVSKGLEVGTGKMMSELIVDVLGRKHPSVFISGPSFAKEVMTLQPTGVVAASKVTWQYFGMSFCRTQRVVQLNCRRGFRQD